jgi:GDPmannose 4,6-dehydratase
LDLEQAIIFGSSGQDGVYLTHLLTNFDIKVIPVSRSSTYFNGDIGDLAFVESLVKKIKPKFNFHLAAISSTKHEFLIDNHNSISAGTLNVLEAVKKYSQETIIFIAGSAMQFRNIGEPINEDTPFEARSAYSAERIYSVYLARYYRDMFKLKVYIGYLFNHDSPIRSETHINQKIVMSAVRIANSNQNKLVIGDLNVRKEFNYAGDIVSAIWKLVNQDAKTEMVIGSGEAYSIKSWVQYCFGMLGLEWEDHVVIDDNFSSEYEVLVSDPALLLSTGWVPTKSIYGVADLMLESAKNRF